MAEEYLHPANYWCRCGNVAEWYFGVLDEHGHYNHACASCDEHLVEDLHQLDDLNVNVTVRRENRHLDAPPQGLA